MTRAETIRAALGNIAHLKKLLKEKEQCRQDLARFIVQDREHDARTLQRAQDSEKKLVKEFWKIEGAEASAPALTE